MASREVSRGPTAVRAAQNLRGLRDARGWTLARLSEELEKVGRPLVPSGVSKLESGQRRMDVDDLMAMSLALGVNPSRILLLASDDDDGLVPLTNTVIVTAQQAWEWADGRGPLGGDPDQASDRWLDFLRLSRPPARRGLRGRDVQDG